MSKKKTHEEYVAELAIKNPNVEVVGEYINAKTKIMFHCLIHDVYWEALPYAPLRGHGCNMCHGEKIHNFKTRTNEQYIKELQEVNKDIIVLENYIDIRTPILHKCIKHNVTWKASPGNVLKGCGCRKCGGDKNKILFAKTHEEYVSELKLLNNNIIVLGTYINNSTPILHKCLIDGNEWSAAPSWILSGTGCPQCNESKGEKKIREWLVKNNIMYTTQETFNDCKDKLLLPFDFYLQEYNCCIEYDGIQHYEPIEHFGGQDAFEIRKKHDEIKNNYCKDNGISLLRIPYYANIEEELNNFLFI